MMNCVNHGDIEWVPKPVIELSLTGDVINLNLAARAQFPSLSKLGCHHPILADLNNKLRDLTEIKGEFIVFFKEVKYLDTIFEQHIVSFPDKKSILVYLDDITARTLAERQLNKRNLELTETTVFLNNILESSIDYSIIALDLKGMILTWNAGAKRCYGYSLKEVKEKINIGYLVLSEEVESEHIKKFMDLALKDGKAEGIFQCQRKNGENFMASIVMNVRRDSFGNSIGFIFISNDITEKKRLEEQLRINQELEEKNRLEKESNQLKDIFLHNMSHELRTPLNGIIGFSQLLYSGKLGEINEDQKDALSDVLTSANNLQHLVGEILDITDLECERIAFSAKEFNVQEVIEEVINNFSVDIKKKSAQVLLQVDKLVQGVSLDKHRFKQVTYNYLSNALKFSPTNSKVFIRILRESDEMFRLEVEDNGELIKAEFMKKLFTPFQKLDAGSGKHFSGAGIGLYLTKKLVEAQGGWVGVQGLENGKVFFAIFPYIYPN